jgi:hypothetical protein
MAAGLGFKEFTTGDVLTAADANGYLASQVVMVFASSAARTSAIASPQEGMIAYLKDTNAVEKYDGAAWVSVGGGGGGKVLQVVMAQTTTATTIATNVFTDTTLTGSITPSSATSKVLVLFTQQVRVSRSSTDQQGAYQLVRGATSILNLGPSGYETHGVDVGSNGSSSLILRGIVSGAYLDSPATTSATTYKTQFKIFSTANSGSSIINENSTPATLILMEIGA